MRGDFKVELIKAEAHTTSQQVESAQIEDNLHIGNHMGVLQKPIAESNR